jgi:transposase
MITMPRPVLGRPKEPLVLTEDEQAHLERLSRRPTTAQSIAKRAQVVLLCARGQDNKAVAKAVGLGQASVGRWRRRFITMRMAGLTDAPRSGAPRSISDDDIEAVIVATLESKPAMATHWSTRDMAKRTGYSASSIGRIWRAFGLKPHREGTFKLSTDPEFVAKVRDVVGLYLNPPDRALVLCVDEKTQIQALERTQQLLPMQPGRIARRTHDYTRHGTTSLFAALDHKTGTIIGKCYARHRAKEFRDFLGIIDGKTPSDLDVHLIVDNASTHKAPTVRRWLAAHPRFHVHFTPTSSSWLNLVERWFGLLAEKQIKRGVHTSVSELKASIMTYLEQTNSDPKPFVWTKSADRILESVKNACRSTLRAHAPGVMPTTSGTPH